MTYYHHRYGSNKKKKSIFARIFLWLIVILVVVTAAISWFMYEIVLQPNVWTPSGEPVSVFIPTGADFDQVKSILYEKGLIVHRANFEWWAHKKNYPELVKPGHYVIQNNLSNNALIDMLRSGKQVPVRVVFNNQRDIYQLAGRVSEQIEADSASIVVFLTNEATLQKFNLTKETISCLFIPNTYEFYWNTSATGFTERMEEEYLTFWNDARKMQARNMNMTIPQVITLASIVEKETNKNDEKALIAGVYVNRLDAGWLLQADPTLVYALNDKNIHRVLNVHKDIESPYNTYKNPGLPPGPICIPSIASIDAVLNHSHEENLFFCAKDDLSGYHVFTKSYAQHNRNAYKYRKALDEMKVFK